MSTQLLNGLQVAEILGISRAFAYKLMRSGRIPSVRIGRSIRVRPSDLDIFISKYLVVEAENTSTIDVLELASIRARNGEDELVPTVWEK